MNEHKIILPSFANDGGSIERQRAGTLHSLTRAFGGMTSWPAQGHWQNPITGAMQTEAVTVHVVAFAPTTANVQAFRAIAAEFARDAKQHSVYIALANGETELIEPATPHHVTGRYPPADLEHAAAH